MRRYIVIGSLILCCLMVVGALAQTQTARLEGSVTDQTGAVIPAAKITAVNVRTDVSAETTSNAAGLYVFAAMLPGTYTVSAEAQGFRKLVHTDVILSASQTVAETFKLEVGQVTQSVVVESNIERLNTSDAQVGRSVTMRDIDVLPQLGRAPINLVVFQPGVQVDPGDATFSRVNGLRQGSNNSTLDGIDVNDAVVPRLGLSLTANNTDSVGEVRMVTNGGKAEYGRSAGAQVELITRSGTNEFHGNIFDYLRNTDLNANNFFNKSSGVSRPILIQNIFGGSLGGPIKHDKLFIFGNYQGRRTTQTTVRNRTVLTPQAKSGLFRWKDATGAIQSFNIIQNDPRKIGIDKTVAGNLALLPDPNNFDVGDGLNTGGFRFNNPSGSMEDQFTIKGDFNPNSTHHFFYRHSWQRNSSLDALNSADSTFPGQPSGTQGGHRWGIAGGWEWSIKPQLVNEFRYGHQSAQVAFNRPRLPQALIVSNLFTDPLATAFEQGRNSPVNEFTDNATIIRGKHAFKGGGNIRYTKQYGYNAAGIYPNITLARSNGATPPGTIGPQGLASTDRSTFENLYNDVLGRISQVTQTFYSDLQNWQKPGTPRVRNFIFHEYGYFFQDDWKIRKNLTLNLGLRWEFNGVPAELDKLAGTLDQAALVDGVSQIANLAVMRTSKWYNNDWNNFAPRIGFAWSPGGSGKTSVRGGYGLYYDRIIGATASSVDGATPGFSQAVPVWPNSSGTSDVRVGDGIPLPQAPAAPQLVLNGDRANSVTVFPPNLRTGYVHHLNFSVQRELLRNTIVEAGYVGTLGVKLFTNRDVNQPRVFGDFLTAFQQLQAFRTNGTAVPASNTLVKMFGSVSAAITGVGGNSTVDQGLVGTAANNVDRNNYTRYAAAGISNFYLRSYPQFNQLRVGGNDGRSYYHSLQTSLRRQVGALKMYINYTFSKSIDNISVDQNGFTSPIDNYNFALNRGLGDYDRRHSANYSIIYTLPVGKNRLVGGNLPRWADTLIGGWEVGALGLWQSGPVFTVSSGRSTANADVNSWANYSGTDRSIGKLMKKGNGTPCTVGACVYYFTPDQIKSFDFAGAGQFGTAGRNTFRGSRFFNIDMSLVKRFKITERQRVNFRVESYNILNNVNFANPGATYQSPATSFGKISGTVNAARVYQMALRYEF